MTEQPAAALAHGAPPVFILTCMRSYSSLVSSMLGQHPGFYCLPEVNPFIADTLGAGVDILRVVRKRTLDGLYRAVAELEFGGQGPDEVAEAIGFVETHRHWTARDLMGWFAARVHPRRLIEKSPSTVLTPDRLETARAAFPDALFLHLYRHPVATTASIARITGMDGVGGDGKPGRRRAQRDPENAWFGINRDILALGARLAPGQFLSVMGETLLSDPDLYLPQIAAWAGLATSPADLEAMRHPEDSPYAHEGPPMAPFGNDPNFLRDPTFVQRPIHNPPLSSALDWAGPAAGSPRHLAPETLRLAWQLGYGAHGA